jgi:hypothetical protein
MVSERVRTNQADLAGVSLSGMERAKRASTWLLALMLAGCGRLSTSPIAGPVSSPSATASPAGPMIPSPEGTGGQSSLDLTFPDGTSATVSYPGHLDLAGMGIQPDVDLAWGDRWVGAIVFSHGGPEQRILAGTGPAAIYQRDGAAIEEWEVQRRGGRHQATDAWLVYELEDWTVHVPVGDHMDPEEVIDRVNPYETEDGFVVVEVADPADLAEGYGEAGGPQLSFGDRNPLPDFISTSNDDLLIDVAPSECGHFEPTVQVNGEYASACLGGALFVNGTSFSGSRESRDKLAAIVGGLRLMGLQPAR